MATELERLILRIQGDSSDLRRELRKTEGDVDASSRRLKSSLEKAGQGFSAIKAGLAGIAGLAVVGVARQVLELAENALEAADALQDASDRLGVGTEALQEFRFAAKQAGVESEALDAALAKLGQNQVRAVDGSKKQAEAFERIGISVEQLRRLSVDELFLRVADGIKAAGTEQERLAVTADLFGKGAGPALVNVLQGGSEALAALGAEARATGAVISAELVQKGSEAADQLDKLRVASGAQLTSVLIELAPAVLAVGRAVGWTAEKINEAVQSYRELEDRSLDVLKRQRDQIAESVKIQREAQAMGGPKTFDFNAQVRTLGQMDAEITRRERIPLAAALGFDETGNPLRQATPARSEIAPADEGDKPKTKTARAAARKGETEAAREYESALKSLRREEEQAAEADERWVSAIVERGIPAREKVAQEIERLDGLLRTGAIGVDEYSDAWNVLNEDLAAIEEEGLQSIKSLSAAGSELASTLGRAFADMAISGEISFKRLGQSLARDLLGKLAEVGVDLASDAIGSLLTGALGGAFAEGGSFAGDKPILVGERGPELIVPRAPGTVIPLRGGGGSSAAAPITVNVMNQVPTARATVRERQTGNMRREIQVMVEQIIQSDVAGRGNISRSLEGSYGAMKRTGG